MCEESIYDIDKREYLVIESPVGYLRITGNDDYIFEIAFLEDNTGFCKTLPKAVEKCAKQLKQYFHMKRKTFDLLLKPAGTDFQKSVWKQLHNISFGRTTTYGKQAAKSGNLRAIRAVGVANSKNPIPIIIPCHRVIGSDGSLTGYMGGVDKKEWLLSHEGAISGIQMNMFG